MSKAAAPAKGGPTSQRKSATSKKGAPATSSNGSLEITGITVKKTENFSEWYTQVITKSDMIEYYDVSGCYILRPWSFFIWETIQEFVNAEIKALGVKNCYFPMFVSKAKLEAEKEHVEGFSPEVAWVTKYGESDLAEPIAIRPTSETIMYPAFAKWVRSHRDLPVKVNQWCQVVRWEFKQPTPFIRTREFLWQEGHTAHETDEEAHAMVLKALDIYARVYKGLLAVPVIKGFKSETEKFAGGKMTTTVETLILANGRSVQAATSHHLGTNFSKMFNIEFEDRNRQHQYAHQTSWGLSTRSLGVAIMVHGDDKGMVLPPKVANVQVVVVPIIYKGQDREKLLAQCSIIKESLEDRKIRVYVDDRENYTPGWKYNHWEVKGVCIRLELGPRDLTNGTVRCVRRDNGEKKDLSLETLPEEIESLLETIHDDMYTRADEALQSSIVKVTEWSEVMPALNARKMILAPWCEDPATEEDIKKETTRLSQLVAPEAGSDSDAKFAAQENALLNGLTSAGEMNSGVVSSLTGAMKALCIPFEQPAMPSDQKCFFAADKPAKRWCLFGRSY